MPVAVRAIRSMASCRWTRQGPMHNHDPCCRPCTEKGCWLLRSAQSHRFWRPKTAECENQMVNKSIRAVLRYCPPTFDSTISRPTSLALHPFDSLFTKPIPSLYNN
jgi:hypothetical protein